MRVVVSSPGFARSALAEAMVHGLFWLVVANGVGVLLALLLLVPGGNALFGEWTYGRWVPVHLNLQLFGWTSLPLVGWLLRVYRLDEVGLRFFGQVAVWAWSLALVVGALAWLGGRTSGKIFLDWSGGSLAVFVGALLVLWVVLAMGWWKSGRGWGRFAGLVALAVVPVSMVLAASREIYPPVNPSTGGPTGASLLGSTLFVVCLLLLVPRSLGKVRIKGGWWTKVAWAVFAGEAVCWVLLEKPQASHWEVGQWLGLGLLLLWVPLLPLFFRTYAWERTERRWLRGFLAWLILLLISGWLAFLPGVLDEIKFTSSLVAHSHLAMAGFTSAFLLFMMASLSGRGELLLAGFWSWNLAVLGYVVLMMVAGICEARDWGWVMEGGAGRRWVYALRFLCGLVLLGVSWRWFRKVLEASELFRKKGAPVSS
jgi:cytochrome c oxidase cbb3-type subunit 1